LALALGAGVGRAGDTADLAGLIGQPQQHGADSSIGHDNLWASPRGETSTNQDCGPVTLDDGLIQKITADYLQQNAGAGLTPGLPIGNAFDTGATSNPNFLNWNDAGKFPFELRVRGEFQLLLSFTR